ncbi:MAG: hypothetical protein ACYCXW_03640 [Solirubrobacteraceae bacterium]
MSISAPNSPTDAALASLLTVMIEIKDALEQIASSVQTLSSAGSG